MSSIFWEQIKNKKAVKRLNCRAGADFEAGMFDIVQGNRC